MGIHHLKFLLVHCCTVVVTLLAPVPRPVGAQPESWEPLGLSQVVRLSAPASGALLAVTGTGLFRSDDAGASWSEVRLPDGPVDLERIAVDPLDHRVIYVPSEQGLYRTDDDAVTWNRILEIDVPIRGIALSPAAPGRVYVSLADGLEPTRLRRFLVSHDAGMTWTERERLENRGDRPGLCNWRLSALAADRSVAGRVFRVWYCDGGTRTPVLQRSDDDGGTWTDNLVLPVFAQYFAGSRGAAGERLYLAGFREPREGGSAALVSLDGGVSWVPIIAFEGGGLNLEGPLVQIGGLAMDPVDPTSIWLGLNRSAVRASPRTFAGEVILSGDGGMTWAALSGGALARLNDLVLGIDGRYLFVATETGVYRRMLP
jgi:photosystem II stability/assembly factor-like uncharacterized protein